MFQIVGHPMAKACRDGFNGTIICYGQTGTGKSYTTFGPADAAVNMKDNTERGLVPRVFEFLFSMNDRMVVDGAGRTELTAKCSFYEIYQEKIYDLLNMSNNDSLQVREDHKLGVFVDGIKEELVTSSAEAFNILTVGYSNRHVGATAMNRESSRSHAVFQLNLEVTEEQENGVRICKKSRFSLVDLAGSERQKDTNATGERLKEASVINKSLSALGNVINSLSANESNVKPKHVHYRDSKLTFLLRDSLGGNSKTVLVATVTSVESCIAETMSTLKFAQRAKSIRNIVMRNEESTGTIASLQKEIVMLKSKLSKLQDPSELEGRISLGRTSAALSTSAAAYEELIMKADLKYKSLNEKFEASEKSGLGMKMTLKMRDSEVQRLKKTIGDTKDEYSIMLRQYEAANKRIDELSTTITTLHRDIEERDEAAKSALGDVQRSGDELIEQYKAKETASRDAYNKAMKDNMVLLKSSRELSAQAETLKQAYSAKEMEYENLQLEYSQLKEQHDLSVAASTNALAEKDATIKELMKRFNEAQETILNISAYSKHLEETNDSLTAQLQAAANENASLQKECDETKYQLVQAKEELEGYYMQTQTLLSEREQMQVQVQQLTVDKEGLHNVVVQTTSLLTSQETQNKNLMSEREQLQLQVQQLNGDKENLHNVVVQTTGLLTSQEAMISQLHESISEKDKIESALTTSLTELQSSLVEKDAAIASVTESLALKAAEADALSTELAQSAAQLTAATAEADALTAKVLDAAAQLSAKTDEVDKISTKLVEAEAQLVAKEAETSALTSQLAEAETQLVAKEAETSALTSQLAEAETQLKLRTTEIESMSAQLAQAAADVDTKCSDAEVLSAKLVDAAAQLNSKTAQVEELQRHIDSMQASVADAQNRVNKKNEEVSALGSKVSSLLAQLSEEEHARSNANKQIAELVTKVETKEKEFSECKNAYKLAKSKYDEGKVTIEELRKEISVQKKQLVDIEYLQDSVKKSTEALKKEKEMKISLLEQIQRTEHELNELQAQYKKVTESQYQLSQQLADTQSENAKLCGHQNSKQKIQAHLQLKKDIIEQAALVKQQQDRIIELTLERDAAKAELKKRKVTVSTEQENIPVGDVEKPVDGTEGATLKRSRRVALKDASNQVK